MSKLFSEIYGCYYGIVQRVLLEASDGISVNDIEKIINERGFSETAFHLLPELIGGGWSFLEKRGEKYYAKLSGQSPRPITTLELSWLAALLGDERISLFLSDERIAEIRSALSGIKPAFNASDVIFIDKHLDGDPYTNPVYISNFRKILSACKSGQPLEISYDSEKSGRTTRTYHPYKLSYSYLNDKFRLLAAVYNKKAQKLNTVTLNLQRITTVSDSALPYRAAPTDLCKLFLETKKNPPLVIEITNERNALERFLLQFASFDRKTEYDAERNIYTCQISYDPSDETELLIRVLSFGWTIKVLSPQNFVSQIKERLKTQLSLSNRLP